MGKRRLAFSELRRIDRGSRPAVSFESEDDLPDVPQYAMDAYKVCKQQFVFAAMSCAPEVFRVWYCHNCRRFTGRAESEQADLPLNAKLINCVRCHAKASQLVSTFNQRPG